MFFKCVDSLTQTTTRPKGWGHKKGLEFKENLLREGYHNTSCSEMFKTVTSKDRSEQDDQTDINDHKRDQDVTTSGPDPTIEDYMSESALKLHQVKHLFRPRR